MLFFSYEAILNRKCNNMSSKIKADRNKKVKLDLKTDVENLGK